jgi:hypothetical protein
MCFFRKKAKITVNYEFDDKVAKLFTSYINTIMVFLASGVNSEKIYLTPDIKNKLSEIKARIIGYSNKYSVDNNNNTYNIYVQHIELIETIFNSTCRTLYNTNLLSIDEKLRKIRSIQELFNIENITKNNMK